MPQRDSLRSELLRRALPTPSRIPGKRPIVSALRMLAAELMSGTKPLGLGNVNLYDRPPVVIPGKGIGSIYSMSFDDGDAGEVVIPSIVNGRLLSPDDAYTHYKQTGEHIGRFRNPEEATRFSDMLSHLQNWFATGELSK
jgi:hypothetical protein